MTLRRVTRLTLVVCVVAHCGLVAYGVLLTATPDLLFAPVTADVSADASSYMHGVARLVSPSTPTRPNRRPATAWASSMTG